MSKFGETVDRVLELLKAREKVRVNELEKKAPLADIAILNFMSELGLIELKKEEVRITDFGLGLLTL